jgi:exosortase/archaeosortase family protein
MSLQNCSPKSTDEAKGGDETTDAGRVSSNSRRTRRAQLRFVARFAVTAVVLLALYYFPYASDSGARATINSFLHVYAGTTGLILRAFDPSVRVSGEVISGAFAMRIAQTCDAMDVTILLVAAIASWHGPIRRRIVASLASALALAVLNVVRLCSLYLIGMMRPSFFEAAHLDVWPAVILVAAVALFLGFTSLKQRRALTTASP